MDVIDFCSLMSTIYSICLIDVRVSRLCHCIFLFRANDNFSSDDVSSHCFAARPIGRLFPVPRCHDFSERFPQHFAHLLHRPQREWIVLKGMLDHLLTVIGP